MLDGRYNRIHTGTTTQPGTQTMQNQAATLTQMPASELRVGGVYLMARLYVTCTVTSLDNGVDFVMDTADGKAKGACDVETFLAGCQLLA